MAARSSPRVDTGAVDRPCGLGRWGRGCWGPFWAGVWTHGHTGELPGHSRAQRPLQAEGGWVGLWSRVSGGRSLQWGGRGGGGVYKAHPSAPRIMPGSCHRAPSRAVSAGPRPLPPGAAVSWAQGHIAPATVHLRVCLRLLCGGTCTLGPPRGSSTSDASLPFTGKTLSHKSWGSGPPHVSEDHRSAHGSVSAAARLPWWSLSHALSQAAFSGLPCPSWPSSRKPFLPVSCPQAWGSSSLVCGFLRAGCAHTSFCARPLSCVHTHLPSSAQLCT